MSMDPKEALALFEDIEKRDIAAGMRDDPVTIRISEAIAKLKAPAPKAAEVPHKK